MFRFGFLYVTFVFFLTPLFCNGTQIESFQGKNYVLNLKNDFEISLRRQDGTTRPFLKGINFQAATREWKTSFRGNGFDTECLERTPDRAIFRITYHFIGPDAKRISLNGTVEAYSEWLRLRFNGCYEGDISKYMHRRLLFWYQGKDMRITRMESDSREEYPNGGIQFESISPLQLVYVPSQKHTSVPLYWTQKNGKSFLNLEFALEPFFNKASEFSRLSTEPYEIHCSFPRPCNIVLDGDKRNVTLKLLNRSSKSIDSFAKLSIRDFQDNPVSCADIKLKAASGKIAVQTIALPENRYGWFGMKIVLPSIKPVSQDFCIIPPVKRLFSKQSIFGGIIYPWNVKTTEKLDMMHWIGMSTIRRAYPIMKNGEPVPARQKDGCWSFEATGKILFEQTQRCIEPVPRTSNSWNFPRGTFRLTESENEVNIRKLPVAYAEELKIEYVKTKLHDPELQVGSTGMAGVDLHWLEELQENEIWHYFDALFVHLHCFPRAPEVNNTMTREFWLHDRVTLLRSLMDKYGKKPVYDSENGYLTRYPDRRVESYRLRSVSDSSIAAAFMVRTYLQCLAYGVSCKMWFTIDSYGGFGITEKGQPLPAFPAYAAMTWLLDGAKYVGELLAPGRVSKAMDQNAEFSRSWFGQATPGLEKELLDADRDNAPKEAVIDLPPYAYIRAFRRPDGSPLLACWATLYRQKVVSEPINTPAWKGMNPGESLLWNGAKALQAPKPLKVRFKVGSQEVLITDMMGNSRKVKTENGFLTLALDDYPQFVSGVSPALLKDAERFNLNIFTTEFQPNNRWKTLIQAVLPATGEHPRRKSVFDKPNLSAELEAGKPYKVFVRLTNLGKDTETGSISLRLPKEWDCTPESVRFKIAPKVEKKMVATFQVTPKAAVSKAKIISEVKSNRLGKIADSVMNVSVK